LAGITPGGAAHADILQLLQSTRVSDERSAVQQELVQLEAEIKALENDRSYLQKTLRNVTALTAANSNGGSVLTGRSSADGAAGQGGLMMTVAGSPSIEWDVHKILREDALKQQQQQLQHSERMAFQKHRGNCITIHLHNPKTQELFVHKCGGKLQHIQRTRLFKNDDTIVTLSPSTCRPHGAATALQHVGLISADKYNGFYFSRDTGRSQACGHVPNKLFRRMKQEERHDIGDLQYLSTGPHGCYYAEFHSGECWWGSAVEDSDFHRVMQSWDVHRVAFGSIEYFEDDERQPPSFRDGIIISSSNGKVIATNSWIVLSRDGRAAWKNIPPRLSQKLECRLASWSAPVEVSLGPGNSYFVRYLDGTIDYCLPAKLARVCDRIEKRGGVITNVCLHPDISHDFVIRHTELTVTV
jgi:hypothetical protein